MASFRWKGRTADGHDVSGNLDAGSKTARPNGWPRLPTPRRHAIPGPNDSFLKPVTD
jgi:hypothetical protein